MEVQVSSLLLWLCDCGQISSLLGPPVTSSVKKGLCSFSHMIVVRIKEVKSSQ